MDQRVKWEGTSVTSPHIRNAVSTVAAKDIPYQQNSNRLQNLSIYLPRSPSTNPLIGTHATNLPLSTKSSPWLVYIHGGAWRDPLVTASAIEPTVAHALSAATPIAPIVSLNYSLSPYPAHPSHPYDPAKGDQNDASREVQHPVHIHDVMAGLGYLHDVFGLRDGEYVLVGHSCGATLAFQAALVSASTWGANEPPRPAAIVGLNGLYDLPLLLRGPSTHAHLEDICASFLNLAFGEDEGAWEAASPAKFTGEEVRKRGEQGRLPQLMVLDQSEADQLVPLAQTEAMEVSATGWNKMRVVRGSRMKGLHDEAWESGVMILEILEDVIKLLAE